MTCVCESCAVGNLIITMCGKADDHSVLGAAHIEVSMDCHVAKLYVNY